MPAYNAGNYIEEAVNSILDQSYSNFEFIIIDDGSTDCTPEILKCLTDPRIKLIFNEKNEGNYPARNKACRLAKGKYIAVMDADDIAFPERLMKQYIYMEENLDVGVLGCRVRLSSGEVWWFSYPPETMKIMLLKSNCICHPTMFIRKEAIFHYDLFYNESFHYSADYEFLTKAVDVVNIRIFPEILLMYRRHANQISSAKFGQQTEFAAQIRLNYIKKTGVYLTMNENKVFEKLFCSVISKSEISVLKYIKVVEKIIAANKVSCYFERKALASLLAQRLLYIIRLSKA